MERDVNQRLIYIILILLIALVGTAVFYQMRYNEMSADYRGSFDALNMTIQNLTLRQKDLYYNISEINVSASREQALTSRLEAKMHELENISRELATLQQELFECNQNYDMLNVNSTISDEILSRHIASIGRLQEKIDRLRTDVANDAPKNVIQQDIDQLQNELNTLKSY